MSEATTKGIRIRVGSTYLPERSSIEEGYYFFSYHVEITNLGETAAQLISRVWVVTDSDGRTERVEGAGVIGQQPVLVPGASFEYTSFCPLPTPVGTMHGIYRMVTDEGDEFDAEIAPFTLAVPGMVN